MNNLFNFKSIQLYNLYNNLLFHKYKDKLDMILEPLQSMIQLAILSVKPIGTKLAIHENILYIQEPSIIQPINRWYNSDKKDDLYFLFQVIKRFIKWYNPENNNKILSSKLYNLICSMSLLGLDNLVKTYNNTDNNSIIQVLHLYKNLLEVPNIKELEKHTNEKINIDEVFENIISLYECLQSKPDKLNNSVSSSNNETIHTNETISVSSKEKEKITFEGKQSISSNESTNLSETIDKKYSKKRDKQDYSPSDKTQIPSEIIIEKSKDIHSNSPLLNIIYNILILINTEENPEYISSYIKSLNYIMEKTNTEIQNWIKVNLNV
jgi:hypothetical protein